MSGEALKIGQNQPHENAGYVAIPDLEPQRVFLQMRLFKITCKVVLQTGTQIHGR